MFQRENLCKMIRMSKSNSGSRFDCRVGYKVEINLNLHSFSVVVRTFKSAKALLTGSCNRCVNSPSRASASSWPTRLTLSDAIARD